MDFCLGENDIHISEKKLADRLLIIGSDDNQIDYDLIQNLILDFYKKEFNVWVVAINGMEHKQFNHIPLEYSFKSHSDLQIFTKGEATVEKCCDFFNSANESNESLILNFQFKEDTKDDYFNNIISGLNMFVVGEIDKGNNKQSIKYKKPLMLMIIGANNTHSELLLNLSTYSKVANINFIAHMDSYSELYKTMLGDESWVISNVIESCKYKIIFNQSDKDESIAVSRLFNIPISIKKRIFKGDQEVCMLNKMKNNECLFVDDNGIEPIILKLKATSNSESNKGIKQ